MSFLSIRVLGQPSLDKTIQHVGGIDTRKVLDEGSAILFNRMRTRFLQEKDPTGTPWPKSRASIQRKNSGRGGGTLFDTGEMFRSLQLYAESATSRAIGTNRTNFAGFPYPKTHQFGIGQIQRIFLGFNQDDAQTMSDLVVKRLVEGLTP